MRCIVKAVAYILMTLVFLDVVQMTGAWWGPAGIVAGIIAFPLFVTVRLVLFLFQGNAPGFLGYLLLLVIAGASFGAVSEPSAPAP